MFDKQVLAFTVTVALLTIAPGSDTMLVLRSVLRRGRIAGIISAVGICTGLLLNNVLNPKPAVFYLAFLPQFIRPTDPVLAKSLFLAGIHFVLGVVWLSTLVFSLGKLGALIAQSALRHKLEIATGAILVGFGV